MTPLAKQLMKENTAVIAGILYKNGIQRVVTSFEISICLCDLVLTFSPYPALTKE